MSNEIIFKTIDLNGYAFNVINILSMSFFMVCYLTDKILPSVDFMKIRNIINNNVLNIRRMMLISLFITVLINIYIVYSAGGIEAFYFSTSWNERSNNNFLFPIIMNFKYIVPCFGIGFCALLFQSKKYRKMSVIVFLLLLFLYVYGGSNRKFAVFGVFIYFSIIIDFLKYKKVENVFYISMIFVFLLSQMLLFLRSSGFNIDSMTSAFSNFSDVILTSEPIGTYSNILNICNAILDGSIKYSGFYDLFKLPLYPIFYFTGYISPNITHVLGDYLLDVDGFTFFPTFIIEGLYNGGVFGYVVYLFLYFYVLYKLIKEITVTSDYLKIITCSIIINICLIQLIRGYISGSTVYLLFILIVFSIFKILFKSKI
ncbi:TPA: O-antigen polymerase [Photobacterium damselae]